MMTSRGSSLLLVGMVMVGLWIAPVTAQPTQAEQLFAKGYSYQTGEAGEKDLGKALQYYQEALGLEPDLFPALYNTGFIYYYSHKNYQQAMKYFIQAIRISRGEFPEYEAIASSGLGSCYQKEGNLEEAEKWFRAAIRKDSTLVEAHTNLVNLLLKEDRREEAKEALAVADRQAPSSHYELFKGRLQGKEGWDEWSPMWLKVAAAGLLGGAILYALLKKAVDSRRRGV